MLKIPLTSRRWDFHMTESFVRKLTNFKMQNQPGSFQPWNEKANWSSYSTIEELKYTSLENQENPQIPRKVFIAKLSVTDLTQIDDLNRSSWEKQKAYNSQGIKMLSLATLQKKKKGNKQNNPNQKKKKRQQQKKKTPTHQKKPN